MNGTTNSIIRRASLRLGKLVQAFGGTTHLAEKLRGLESRASRAVELLHSKRTLGAHAIPSESIYAVLGVGGVRLEDAATIAKKPRQLVTSTTKVIDKCTCQRYSCCSLVSMAFGSYDYCSLPVAASVGAGC